MKTRVRTRIIFLLAMSLVASCKASSSGKDAKPNALRNANASAPQAGPNHPDASPKPGEPPLAGQSQPLGTYVMSEVHDKQGIVSIISEVKTVIHFSPDGTYERSSSKEGTPYHNDWGEYRVEGDDKLVLSIKMSKQKLDNKVHNPPLEKTHRFTLSPDGQELQLTTDDGKMAVFRRTDGG
jgi:hypothetical protein